MRRQLLIPMILATGCGGSNDDTPPGGGDAPPVPATVTITGTAVEQTATGGSPLSGVLVEAFRNSDENTVVTSAMTDANGNYTLTVETNGAPLDGFLKASFGNLLDSYLYPPAPISEDFDGASINMIASNTLSLLTSALACNDPQSNTNGMIAMLVLDGSDKPLEGAVVSSQPAASSDCYNTADRPSGDAPSTFTDGVGYLFNIPAGQVTVSATADNLTFPSHAVNARAGAFTTTLARP